MECIFCEIAKGRVKAKLIHEDEISLAFLDINPRSKGMSIVIPKQHYESFDENLEISARVFLSALIVAKKIKYALNPKEVIFSVIPSDIVKHFHVRIYPVFDEMPVIESKPLSIAEEEMEEIAEKIRSVKIEFKKEEAEEEKEEKERSEEEVYWIKRDFEIP